MNEQYNVIPDLSEMPLRDILNLVNKTCAYVPAFKVHDVAEDNLSGTICELKKEGARGVLCDRKINEMPDKAAARAARIYDAGATMLTIHAAGGPKMIAAVVKSFPGTILAVTKLTSWTDKAIEDFYRRPVLEVLTELATWAAEEGAHGIVCSARHVGELTQNKALGILIKLVPGTRSVGIGANDQKQVDTPYNAAFNGGGNVILVGGRQITKADDPLNALHAMGNEIQRGLTDRLAKATTT